MSMFCVSQRHSKAKFLTAVLCAPLLCPFVANGANALNDSHLPVGSPDWIG